MSNVGLVPNFLIIGAMKAGTTTLFRDLVDHPQLFLPQEKEPETLTKFGDDIDAIRRDYASLFRPAKPHQKLGEASTAYTKRPDYVGAARRALELCGPELKIIYLMRDPVKRAVSQYQHDFGLGRVVEPIDEAILKYDRYVNYSRYDWQLEPWIETFGTEGLLRVPFEAYVRNRGETLNTVCDFLAIDATLLPVLQLDRAFNASEGKPVAPNGFVRGLINSRTYQRIVKPIVPWTLRDRVMRALLPKVRGSSQVLSRSSEEELRSRILGNQNPQSGSTP